MTFSHLVITGDFNLPQIDWDNEASQAPDTHLSQKFLEIIHGCLIYQHVHLPTRYRLGETPNLLDLIFSNEEGMFHNLEYLPGLAKSDHVMLRFTLVCYAEVASCHHQRTQTDYSQLPRGLELLNWEVSDMNLDEAYDTFKSNVLTAMDDCSTSQRPSTRKNLYMNRSAMQLKKKKKELWSTYCKSMDALDHSRFVRCRNKLRSLTRKLRKDHEAKLAKNMKHRPKAFWKYAHSRLKTKCRVEDLLDENGLLVNDSQRKAEVLNHFFSSVFTDEGPEAPPTLPCNYQDPLLEDVDVSPQKVEAKLSSLKPSSAAGPDAIQPRLLKESANILASPLGPKCTI